MLFYDTWAKHDINTRAAPFPLVARKGWGGGGGGGAKNVLKND